MSFAIAAATASLACRAASSIAAWEDAGFPGFAAVVPLAADDGASWRGTTGGVNDFWFTVNGTAGATRLFLGPVGAVLGAVADAAGGPGFAAFSWSDGFGWAAASVVVSLTEGATLDAAGALLSTGNSDVCAEDGDGPAPGAVVSEGCWGG